MPQTANVTLAIPKEIKDKMDSLKEINWSEVMRQALSEKVQRLTLLKKLDDLTSGSKLTEEDINKISAKIKEGIAKRHGLM